MDRLVNAILAGIAEGATFGLVALGIVLVYKATRVLNFAQAEIATLSLYLMWLMTSPPASFPVLPAAVIAIAAAAVMGAATEVVLRPLSDAPRLTVTVATLGIATFLGSAQILWFGPDPHILPALVGGEAFAVSGTPFQWGRVLAFFMTFALGLLLYAFFKRTLFGLGVLAAAQDQTALKLQGVPFTGVSIFTWSSGAVLTALAAIVLAPTIGAFTPFFVTTAVLIPSLAAALVGGGLTSLPGAFVGGLVIGIAQNIAKFFFGAQLPGAEFVAVFVLIIVVLLFRPHGLLGAEA